MSIIDLAEHTEMRDFVRRLQQGDASLGWRGDPNCTVAREPDGSFAIYRLDEDAQWRRLLKASPGMRLDAQPLRMLADRDMHRERDPFNPAEFVLAHNNKVYKAQDDALREAEAVAMDDVLSQAHNPTKNRRYLKNRAA